MTKADLITKETIQNVLDHGYQTDGEYVRPHYKDGSEAHTRFLTGVFEEYDLTKNEFPIMSLRPIAWKSGIKEMLWIYQDKNSNLDFLKNKHGVAWWDEWDIGDRTIGTAYGWVVDHYDLINKLLNDLIRKPYSRRHIMNLYQYKHLDGGGLYPCAYETVWAVRGRYLDMTLIQRSSDYLVANHINKLQYIALQMMVARHCGYEVGMFRHYVNNLHIYDRHIDQAHELIKRTPNENNNPSLILSKSKKSFYDITIDDFELINYHPIKPNLKFEMAV